MTFDQLGLIPSILSALRDQGYEKPSPIQEKAIPPALKGRDVLGCAQTGTGKTCAFATPILQQLYQRKYRKGPGQVRPIRALILTPTRELALQIQESFEGYGKNLPLRSAVIFGGVGQQPQVDALQRGVDILVATPGRLQDLHDQGFIHVENLEIFVLDEADRMLDMGFIHDVKKILTWLPKKKQTLFFSATMPPEVQGLVNSLLTDPARVAVDPVSSPVEVINQKLYYVDRANKSKLLSSLIQAPGVKNALVFTRTKHGANKVAGDLQKAGIPAAAIHGNKSQTARVQALTDFKAGNIKALVATDIAARGIDIEELSHVFNYNLPDVPETYIHRIGRTGRAGHGGTAISFCEFGEKELLGPIEKLLKKPIPVVENHPWPMENFEAPKRDKHGKIVNADDDEARQAARERKKLRDEAKRTQEENKAVRQQPVPQKGQPAPKEQRPAPKPEQQPRPQERQPRKAQPKADPQPRQDRPAQTGAAGKRVSAGYKPSRTIDEALTAMAPKPMTRSQAKAQPKAEPKSDRDTAFEAWLAEERKIQEQMRREDPLAGEVIMDATARLLAPKGSLPDRKPVQPTAHPVRQAPQDPDAQARRAIMEARNGASTKKPPNPKKEPRQPRVTIGKGRSYAPKPKAEQPAEPKPAQKQQPASTWVNPTPTKHREDRAKRQADRRRGKGGDDPRSWSAQKDSTEQNGSLMKPYYFIPDDDED